MSEITASLVKELRERTGVSMMECKKALEETQWEMEKAIEELRKRGIARAAKREGRDAKMGIVDAYIHPGGKVGVLLQLNCETDFVARTDDFKALSKDLCMQIAAANPQYVSAEEIPADILAKEKEIIGEQLKAEGKPANMVEKITEGKLKKYYEEVCLLNQKFVKDDSKTIDEVVKGIIAKLGENITIGRFARFAYN